MENYKKTKKSSIGLVNAQIMGIGMLVVTTVVMLVLVSTLLGANLLTTGSEYANVSNRMGTNYTAGIDQISSKIPTIMLIFAVVFLFSGLIFLVAYAVRMSRGMGGGVNL